MHLPRTRRNKALLAIFAISLMALPFAVRAAYNMTLTEQVVVNNALLATSATSDGQICTITGQTIQCPLEHLNTGSNYNIVIALTNTASSTLAITFTAISTVVTLESVSPASGTTVISGASQTFTLNFLGTSSGTDGLSLTIGAN